MAQKEIPEDWRKDVCAVLRTGRTGHEIEWTFDAATRFESSFNFAFQNELYPILRQFFEGPPVPTGCSIVMTKPVGQTYEFLFQFHGVQTYGKILLKQSRKAIMIFSAHLPLKPKLSCD